MRANRAYELKVRRGGLMPSRIASANRIDSIEIVDIASAEVLFFRDCRARDAATYLLVERDAAAHDHGRGPRHVARTPTPAEATRQAHPAAADPPLTASRPRRTRS